jgi:hypothetical protein
MQSSLAAASSVSPDQLNSMQLMGPGLSLNTFAICRLEYCEMFAAAIFSLD